MAGRQFRQTMSPTEAFMQALTRRGYTEGEAGAIMRCIDLLRSTDHPLITAAQILGGTLPTLQMRMEMYAARRVSTAAHDILQRWDEVAPNRDYIHELTQFQANMLAEFAREIVPPRKLVPRREQ